MSRIITWLQHHENRMFCFVNQRIRHQVLDFFFNIITHLGGATASIATALCIALFAEGVWKSAGIVSCIALGLSHVPVAIIKKKYPRLRPYLVLEGTNTCKNPLRDHSFPSGHTTAIFSVTVPLMFITPWLAAILIPLASLVGMSRIYLGLHYPSDVLAGSLIGTMTALTTVAFFG
ncbi:MULTISPECIES: phosphatase PAP2 family protein [unclassified Paenibacillus]|uniref:phosphatase PAP2 family protein n=1 Tax=unclassified Paenibacillus TaxID=185978 RepID=UPI001AE280D7|nr:MULTISPECIES: phosphatase PAP2 family protein [unclassified Paenibacillus]MBP1157365.1 undecaprenyl-diphosphatase [Paenibacillus sp. PvP091]MBP1171897.1 undecaprenyl-diphosphatase [Paenibacillus sp. PvR098]MBP2438278.1 undecaprenyl-diphosphatase [Paenibacillus sp. PvP052]